jgi:hypothetical protein
MKKEPWRWVVGLLSAGVIVYLWSTKDIAGQYAGMPKEQLVPLIVTNVAVTLVKVLAIAGVVWLVRWLATKWNKRDQ